MENVKKPSRFGVRLSTIMVAVLLVVCMAVPAFAYGVYPSDIPSPPVGGHYFICRAMVNGTQSYKLYPIDGYTRLYCTTTGSGSYRYYFNSSSSGIEVNYYALVGTWVQQSSAASFTLPDPIEIVYCTMDVNIGSTTIDFIVPPPPDPLESVGSGLTIVLDWVGATVSALFSGELAGLLPLVAVPVAITLLLVAIIVIKRSIWGA